MRHLDSGRKLGVSSPHRKAMMRSLALALVERDSIKTTPAKAKELRRVADKVITLGKKGSVHAQRQLLKLFGTTKTGTPGSNRVRMAMKRVNTELVPRFKSRNGGYTQIFRIGRRPGDNAEMCVMQYIPADAKTKPTKGKAKKKPAQKAKAKAQDKPVKQKAAAPKKQASKKAAPQDKPMKTQVKQKTSTRASTSKKG